MGDEAQEEQRGLESRVEKALLRCVEWSQAGRHRKVLSEVERLLPRVRRWPQLEAQLLVWKAQALLSMGHPERAHHAASRSWDMEPSPYACYALAAALSAVGEADRAERLLGVGRDLFPDAVHLPVQLAMIQADQGRLPEALDILAELEPRADLPEDIEVFLFGLRANLLAAVGRWGEADGLLKRGLGQHPEAVLLRETHLSLTRAWDRARAEEELASSWESSLDALEGVLAEVDEAILRCGAVLELPRLQVLAARRLWRAFAHSGGPRLQAPDPWGAAALLAIAELDGQRPSSSATARAIQASPSTLRSALAQLRSYLAGLELELARRSFAALSNPRLETTAGGSASAGSRATVIPFPTSENRQERP